MNHEKMREHVHTGIDRQCASLTSDPYRVQRVLNMAHEAPGTGGFIVKKKMSAGLIFAIVMMLLTVTAVAAVLLNLHIEKAMDIAVDKGEFTEWELDDKIALINAMTEAGIPLPQDKLSVIGDADSSDEERDRAATEILVDIYGNEEHISHFTIASHDWGDPFQWTLEQQVWFWETLREKGLYTGKIKYLLPGENDLTRDQVVRIAKKTIQDAYDLPEEIVQAYDADVTFFTIEGTDVAPRWRVYLGYVNAEAAEYTVLLTRDGQVTEDASLYIFKPGVSVTSAPQNDQPSTVLKPYEKRLLATEELYLSHRNMQYHFLSNCPSVEAEVLSATDNIDGYEPCPYCVLQTQLWSVEDKIIYGVMYGELPTEAVISASQAEQIAIDYLLSYGMDDIINLIPYSRYLTIDNQCQYTVFFARLDNGQIAPIYSVIVDAKTGKVLSTFDPTANGLG